jgi:hypothetical protein
MGWSVRWSIQGAIITFTETLKTIEVVANNLANLPEHLARTHYESEQCPLCILYGSLHDCAIHSSRWVDFTDFGLVGFRFFVRLVKMLRALINETTARYGVFGCSWSYPPWCKHHYPVCPIWPSCAIVRKDPRIVFAHTLRHLLFEDVQFLSLGPTEWFFFRVYVKADFVTSTLICGLPMGTPWSLVSDDASIFFARKKQVNNTYLCDK